MHGTASTLQRDEFLMGIFTPASYGVFDSLTVFVHPINFILLTPNGGLRWRVVDADVFKLAMTAEGAGTFLESDAMVEGDRPIAFINTGTVATFYAPEGLMFSFNVGYQHDFGLATNIDEDNLSFGAGINWLIHPSHLLLLTGGALYSFQRGELKRPFGSVMYAKAWEHMRLGLGVAFGEFPLDGAPLSPLIAWPVIDLWARY